MKLIVGLGNPGKKYLMTKHNVGFMCLDYFAQKNGLTFKKENKFKGEIVKTQNYILLKPHTFMNLSGESVRLVMDYYNVEIEDVLVIFDDLDLPFGKIRLRPKGGSGGHNGIKSLFQHLPSQEFKRIRIGIDSNPLIDTKDYVLSKINKEEQNILKEAIVKTEDIIHDFKDDLEYSKIMTKYN
jgi:PTH1 family peptidyl-tRNA hydrolase